MFEPCIATTTGSFQDEFVQEHQLCEDLKSHEELEVKLQLVWFNCEILLTLY